MSFRTTAASIIEGIQTDMFDLGSMDSRAGSDPDSIQDTLLRFVVNFESHKKLNVFRILNFESRQNPQEGAVMMAPTPPRPLFASQEWHDYRNDVKNYEKAFLFISLCLENLEQCTFAERHSDYDDSD